MGSYTLSTIFPSQLSSSKINKEHFAAMFATSDILTIISLVVATILGLGAIWAARRYGPSNNPTRVRDIEMGLLHRPHESQADDEEVDNSAQIPPPNVAEHRHNLHEVIGEALEVFSKHLRAHN